MKVRELLELLRLMAPDLEIQAWDFDSEQYEPVTGVAYDDEGTLVYIQTNDQ